MDEKEIIKFINQWKLLNAYYEDNPHFGRDDDDDDECEDWFEVLKYLVDHEEPYILKNMCNELTHRYKEQIFDYAILSCKLGMLKFMYRNISYETTSDDVLTALKTGNNDIVNLVLNNFESDFPFDQLDPDLELNDDIFHRIITDYGPNEKILKTLITNPARLNEYWDLYKTEIILVFIENQIYVKELYDEFEGDFIFRCAVREGADKITLKYIEYYDSINIEDLVDRNCVETIKAISKFDDPYQLFLRAIPVSTELALHFYEIGRLKPTSEALELAIIACDIVIVRLLIFDKTIITQYHLILALDYDSALDIIKLLVSIGMVDIYHHHVMKTAAISRQMPVLVWLADQGCDLEIAYHNRTVTKKDATIANQIKQEMINQKNKRLEASLVILDEILDPDIIKHVLTDYL